MMRSACGAAAAPPCSHFPYALFGFFVRLILIHQYPPLIGLHAPPYSDHPCPDRDTRTACSHVRSRARTLRGCQQRPRRPPGELSHLPIREGHAVLDVRHLGRNLGAPPARTALLGAALGRSADDEAARSCGLGSGLYR